MKAARLREQLLMERGAEPGVEELAGRLGVEAEELVQAMDSCTEVESLQKVISRGTARGRACWSVWSRDGTSRRSCSAGCFWRSFWLPWIRRSGA